jgi:hypothetical protein
MHEKWLQKYIQEFHRQIGFAQIHGPYGYGADFKGVYAGQAVKIEAEWRYADYISHKHTLKFADVLVVATLEPVPEQLKPKLPSIIINLNYEQVIEWAQPRLIKKSKEDYYSYQWRRLSKSLVDLYAYYLKGNKRKIDFVGCRLAFSKNEEHTPAGFRFGTGGKEEGFEGSPEDRVLWDYWLEIAHSVAAHFHFKPALLRPSWIDRVALYFNHTGRITEGESKRFQDVAVFIDDLLKQQES